VYHPGKHHPSKAQISGQGNLPSTPQKPFLRLCLSSTRKAQCQSTGIGRKPYASPHPQGPRPENNAKSHHHCHSYTLPGLFWEFWRAKHCLEEGKEATVPVLMNWIVVRYPSSRQALSCCFRAYGFIKNLCSTTFSHTLVHLITNRQRNRQR